MAGSAFSALCWVIAIICAMSFVRDGIVALAGKSTNADISLHLLAEMHLDRWVAYIFGVGGTGYGIFERKLRQKNIKRLTKKTEELEKRMDPKRTSSQLTEKGKTRRGDK